MLLGRLVLTSRDSHTRNTNTFIAVSQVLPYVVFSCFFFFHVFFLDADGFPTTFLYKHSRSSVQAHVRRCLFDDLCHYASFYARRGGGVFCVGSALVVVSIICTLL